MFPAPAIGRSRYFSRRLGLEPSADLRQHGNAVLTCRSAKASEGFGGGPHHYLLSVRRDWVWVAQSRLLFAAPDSARIGPYPTGNPVTRDG